jgi:regulator of nonsense transcripts 2
MERYIRKMIYGDLNKKSLEKILKQLRKMDWTDPKIVHILNKCFQKIWKIKYSNIHLISILASSLNRYHSDFGVQLVDSVLEEIRVGLEVCGQWLSENIHTFATLTNSIHVAKHL